MTTLKLWEPFEKDLTDFDDFFRGWPFGWGRSLARKPKEGEYVQWAPAVDIREDREHVFIEAELPGLKKNDVKINLEEGVLTLKGERTFEKEDKKKDYHRVERSYGMFCRSFTLPNNVDASKVDAQMKDGILTITLAKKEEAKPKEIEIH